MWVIHDISIQQKKNIPLFFISKNKIKMEVFLYTREYMGGPLEGNYIWNIGKNTNFRKVGNLKF